LHGGQILGIPFSLIMILILIISLFTKEDLRKDKLFYGGLIYFLTIGLFSLTIELIRNFKTDYFDFLYCDPGHWVDKILLAWLIVGSISFIFTYKSLNENKVRKK
jgi:prolipoprotein diacylglyceryltransferase